VLGTILGRFLPHVPLFEGALLTPPQQDQEPRLRLSGANDDLQGTGRSLLGKQGQTLSFLRPAGKARIDGRVFDVVSDGPFIAEGAEIEVVQITGNRVVVRARV
jgi:membrane-bound serine protease (ClpP class)